MCFRQPAFKKAILALKDKGCPRCGAKNTLHQIISGKGCIKCGAPFVVTDVPRPQGSPSRPSAPPKVPPTKGPPGPEVQPAKKQEEE